MAKIGLKQANTLITANSSSTGYGVVYANEISGHKTVSSLEDLYKLYDWMLSASGDNTDNDAIGQLWYVVSEGNFYQLKDWANRKSADGWQVFKTGSDVDLSGYAKTSELNALSDTVSAKLDKTEAESTYIKETELTTVTDEEIDNMWNNN